MLPQGAFDQTYAAKWFVLTRTALLYYTDDVCSKCVGRVSLLNVLQTSYDGVPDSWKFTVTARSGVAFKLKVGMAVV